MRRGCFRVHYGSRIELEITPEPSTAERSAIAAALAEERAGTQSDYRSAWRRAAIDVDLPAGRPSRNEAEPVTDPSI